MNSSRRIITYAIYILLGVALWGARLAGKVDDFWSGMGTALIFVSILGFIRIYRLRKDESYREKMEVAVSDERNHFIRNKAWAWAGYLFVISNGLAVIILKVMGQELLSMAAAYAVCLMLIFYWVSYMVLRQKY